MPGAHAVTATAAANAAAPTATTHTASVAAVAASAVAVAVSGAVEAGAGAGAGAGADAMTSINPFVWMDTSIQILPPAHLRVQPYVSQPKDLGLTMALALP